MKPSDQKYLQERAAERGLFITGREAPINMDAEIFTLSDGIKFYQFGVTGMEMIQNDGDQMKDLIDCRLDEALKTPRKPRFDSVNPPISEVPQRAVQS